MSEEVWQDDLLDRNTEAEFLYKFITDAAANGIIPNGRKSFVLNVKGAWGAGKSFFLSRLADDLAQKGHSVASIDAWKCDPEIDPLVSIVAAIRQNFEASQVKAAVVRDALSVLYTAGGRIVVHAIKGGLLKLGTKFVGQEAVELIDDELANGGLDQAQIDSFQDGLEEGIKEGLQSDELKISMRRYFKSQINEVSAQNDAVEEFSRSAGKLIQASAKSSPFFVIVDELDRCRPTFAIRFLERINHLFDIEDLVFVIGTDSDELEHSICAIYGEKFDSKSYLKRFFSATYQLSDPKLDQIVDLTLKDYKFDPSRFNAGSLDSLDHLLKTISSELLNPRQVKQVISLIYLFQLSWNEESKIDFIFLIILCAANILGNEKLYTEYKTNGNQLPPRFELSLSRISTNVITQGKRSKISFESYFRKVCGHSNRTIRDSLDSLDNQYGTVAEHFREMMIEQFNEHKRETPDFALYEDYIRSASSKAERIG